MPRSFGPILWLALVATCLVTPASAATVAIPEQIVNGGFGTDAAPSLTGWTTQGGTSVNARASTNAINTTAGTTGFDRHFSSSLAVLGDVRGGIADADQGGTDSIAQDFSLLGIVGATSIRLFIDYRTAFDGPDTSATLSDVFSAFLTTPDLTIHTLFTATSAADQQNNNATDQTVSIPCRFGPVSCEGTWTLTFQLVEAAGPSTNTAAGIDGVSVTGEATIRRFVSHPSSLVLLAAGLLALGRLRRRARASDSVG